MAQILNPCLFTSVSDSRSKNCPSRSKSMFMHLQAYNSSPLEKRQTFDSSEEDSSEFGESLRPVEFASSGGILAYLDVTVLNCAFSPVYG